MWVVEVCCGGKVGFGCGSGLGMVGGEGGLGVVRFRGCRGVVGWVRQWLCGGLVEVARWLGVWGRALWSG